jgi:hypothetical protein
MEASAMERSSLSAWGCRAEASFGTGQEAVRHGWKRGVNKDGL